MSWQLAVMLAGVAQWLFFAAMFAMRRRERPLLISSVVLAVIFAILMRPHRQVVSAAALVAGEPVRKSCVSYLRPGMTEANMRNVLGEPAAIVSEQDTQGPGASAWVYQERRCVAHVLEGTVRSVSFE